MRNTITTNHSEEHRSPLSFKHSEYNSAYKELVMTTTLQPRGSKWYARVRWYEERKRHEKVIALKANHKRQALKRYYEVEFFESQIINGDRPEFSWETTIKPIMNLSVAISEYLI